MQSGVLERAAGYVARCGAELDRLHIETLLRARAPDALLASLAARQREDGALLDWRDASGAATVARENSNAARAEHGAPNTKPGAARAELRAPDAAYRGTLRALGVLDGLGLFDHPVPERAVGWLAARQQADGGFGDAELSEDARIAATGAAAGLLAKSPFARASLLRAAEQFLAARFQVERVQRRGYAPVFAYVHLMSGFASERADEVLQWCGRELERGFRSGAFDAVAVAQVFCRARARALPGAALKASELCAALETAQGDDGAFQSRELGALDATLCAVEALQRLGA